MTTARLHRIGLLLVTTLGAAALAGAAPAASAQTSSPPSGPQTSLAEIVVSATRVSDEALTARVVQVLDSDPYLYAPHVTVVTEHGVVRLQGLVTDVHDLYRVLLLARRAAGTRRVLNEIEFIAQNTDLD